MISIILPLGQNENQKNVRLCLDSLNKQTSQNFEVIIITFPNLPQKFFHLFKKYPFVQIITGNWNKSAARNIGARKAKGKYLFHLDADFQLAKNFLAKVESFLHHHPADPLIIPEVFPHPKTLLQKARFLEKKILKNTPLESPRIIKKSLFEKIGGFDVNADPLDDWDLRLSLRKEKIKLSSLACSLTSYQPTNLLFTWKRYFKRGRAYPYLKRKHQQVGQTKLNLKLKLLTKNIHLFLSSPFAALLLFILKPFDLLFFNLGRLFPYKRIGQPYTSPHQARFYEAQRLFKNYDLYKDHAEIQALLALLEPTLPTLEIGAGTGRITKKLVDLGFKIIPTEPSQAMLKEYQKKKNLPKSIKAKVEKLPFSANSIPQTFALRIVWHLKNNQTAIKEMARVTEKNLIFDISNPSRFHNPVFQLILKIFFPHLLQHTYPLSFKKLIKILEKNQFKLIRKLPLEVITPLWLNLLPKKLARKCFSFLYQLDMALAKIIPPGRWLVKLKKTRQKC